MKFEDFRKNVNNKFDEIIKEDREEASKHFGSTRNAYLHGWREALDYVVSGMNKIESKESEQMKEWESYCGNIFDTSDDRDRHELACEYCKKYLEIGGE